MGLTSPLNDVIILTETRSQITASMISLVFLRPWLLVQPGFEPMTFRSVYSALTTELTGRQLVMYGFLKSDRNRPPLPPPPKKKKRRKERKKEKEHFSPLCPSSSPRPGAQVLECQLALTQG